MSVFVSQVFGGLHRCVSQPTLWPLHLSVTHLLSAASASDPDPESVHHAVRLPFPSSSAQLDPLPLSADSHLAGSLSLPPFPDLLPVPDVTEASLQDAPADF